MKRYLVVGGGITGLTAAIHLADAGHTVELWEAEYRLGGKIATSRFAGIDHIDEGADAYLTRVPHAVALAARVGVDDLTAPTGASAAVWHDGLHDIPGGIVLGVPASVRPFITTSLLSWRGKARAATEPFRPRTDSGDSLGALIRARFGDEVHERLVDSLVGSIYATDTDRASLAAIPQIAALAADNRSLLLGARRTRRAAPPTGSGAIFGAPRQGMGALVVAAARYATDLGAAISTGRPASSIERDGSEWIVDGERYDGVVLATPARTTAPLLSGVAPDAAALLAEYEHADVIMVRLTVPGGDWPSRLQGRSGYLVPKPDQRFVTAASFASQKWSHWAPTNGDQLLRVSLGRDGLPVAHLTDDEVIAATVEEVGVHLGFDLQPTETSISRWVGAFPQYRPHHLGRVEAIDAALPTGLVLAGASYRGMGIPACVADGQRAARLVQA